LHSEKLFEAEHLRETQASPGGYESACSTFNDD